MPGSPGTGEILIRFLADELLHLADAVHVPFRYQDDPDARRGSKQLILQHRIRDIDLVDQLRLLPNELLADFQALDGEFVIL